MKLIQKLNASKKFADGFNRTDLGVMIFVLVVLGLLATAFAVHMQQARSLAQCAANLKNLGLAMTLYAKDNSDSLPYAFIKYNDNTSKSWDTLISPFINSENSSIVSSSPSSDVSKQMFLCPLDTIDGQGKTRRTYSMSAHDMDKKNWPPGSSNDTGVGLWWSDKDTDGNVTSGNAALTNVISANGRIPKIRLAMISAPVGTLLLTEQANSFNVLFNYSHATISRGDNQYMDALSTKVNPYHHGKFNFLMVDGHVEALYPTEKPGMWTIRPDD